MTTRVLLAYGLIAAFAAGGLLALWFGVWRQRLACRRRRRAGRVRRAAGLTTHLATPGPVPPTG